MLKLILILFFSTHTFATIPGIEIKDILENNLKTDYLKSLEEKFGDCGSNPESCLSFDRGYARLNLPKKEMCFPYTMCGFYNCMEEKYKCESVGVDYFTKLARPTCNQYVKNINEGQFTKLGVEWIYSVMVCLQKGLVDECEVKRNCPTNNRKKTCEHITEFTLSFHPGCYINSGIGVCKLPMKDKLNIWKTVNPYMTKREREEAYKVIFQCIVPKRG